MERLRAAPKMIPVFKQYYIPEAGPGATSAAGNPIYEFLQLCEAHCKGETLWLFFKRGSKSREEDLGTIDYGAIKRVPFWYETIGKCGIPVF